MLNISAGGVVNTGYQYVYRGASKLYDPSSTNPSSPSPNNGDLYYNTSLSLFMYYDGGRSKWLSVNNYPFEFGRNNTTATGSYYRTTNGLTMSSTRGYVVPWNGTVVGIGYTRSDTDSATFQVMDDGVSIASLASTSAKGTSDSLNADFAQSSVMSVRNATTGNTTTRVHGWVLMRARV